jgi:N-acetylglucosamine repressor
VSSPWKGSVKKATQEATKLHNTQLILKTIYDRDEISRADVARITGLTRSTVSDIVSKLLNDGLVAETGFASSSGGKPPILLSVSDNARYLIGIDLANSEFRGAIVNLRGEIVSRVSMPINERDGDSALELVYTLVEKLLAASDKPIQGIGIGSPGLMDPVKGVVLKSVNLDWENMPLGELLEARYNLPVYIANDSQVAALAEFTFGSVEGSSNLLLVKIGRGIGSGIIINSQPYYGDNYGAGEIGHVVVIQDGERCRCGNFGCLETLVSSRAIAKRAKSIARGNPESILNRFISSLDEIDTEVILRAYQAGDEEVKTIINETGEILGRALAYTVCTLNINTVVIAGSLSRFGNGLRDPVERMVQQCVLPAIGRQTEVVISKLGEDIVVLGAASLILSHEIGVV